MEYTMLTFFWITATSLVTFCCCSLLPDCIKDFIKDLKSQRNQTPSLTFSEPLSYAIEVVIADPIVLENLEVRVLPSCNQGEE